MHRTQSNALCICHKRIECHEIAYQLGLDDVFDVLAYLEKTMAWQQQLQHWRAEKECVTRLLLKDLDEGFCWWS